MTRPTPAPEDPAVVSWATTRESPYAVGSTAASVPPTPAGSPPAAASPAPPASPTPASSSTPALQTAGSSPLPHSAPALNPPTWSGRKTAIAAALAIGISSMGAIGAAAALPSGSDQSGQRQFQRGGPGGGFPGGVPQGAQPGTQPGTQQQPGTMQQVPGEPLQQAPADPADPNASTT